MKILALLLALSLSAAALAEPLRVCATVPDLGDLAKQIGGDDVVVSVFAKGPEDPHFVEARPSFVKELSRADALIQVGLELEIGWLPVLLNGARNAKVMPGQPGYIDASTAIEPLGRHEGTVDRSMGDVHAAGNPHYLLDPENGAQVANLLAERFAILMPAKADSFRERYRVFRQSIDDASREWTALLQPDRGTKAVSDHDMWPYFARRFNLEVVGFLEPKPGLPPTTKHLSALIEEMKRADVRLVLASSYYDPRHARFVSEQTGATVVPLAHQVGARPGADTYLRMIDLNVRSVAEAAKREER